METLFAVCTGLLAAMSAYLMMSGQLMRFILGLLILSNAANLAIFVSGRLTLGAPPLIAPDAYAPPEGVANALPQALVLTAIVIGFGLFAFAIVLALRAWSTLGTLDGDRMRVAEPETQAAARGQASRGDLAGQRLRDLQVERQRRPGSALRLRHSRTSAAAELMHH
ncbi:Na+/H+ antiporter subunit C [Mangrovicoccus ximenensis]|uniref:Na+/H+ antiporter subunit C n=1 Tax=Mangrovicoccus ximenensis TaxID=1911570 RepID=UPI000D37AC66|nr:Na+/H+ antiporter subunit C [Mangrovicoccus ximenensis]